MLGTTTLSLPITTGRYSTSTTHLGVDLLGVVEVIDERFGHDRRAFGFAGIRAAATSRSASRSAPRSAPRSASRSASRGGAGGFSIGFGGAPRHVDCRSHVVVEELAWA